MQHNEQLQICLYSTHLSATHATTICPIETQTRVMNPVLFLEAPGLYTAL